MRWVNLAQRLPPTDKKAPIIRRISDQSTNIGGIFHLTRETPPRWTVWDPKRNKRVTSANFSNYEWLEETISQEQQEALDILLSFFKSLCAIVDPTWEELSMKSRIGKHLLKYGMLSCSRGGLKREGASCSLNTMCKFPNCLE